VLHDGGVGRVGEIGKADIRRFHGAAGPGFVAREVDEPHLSPLRDEAIGHLDISDALLRIGVERVVGHCKVAESGFAVYGRNDDGTKECAVSGARGVMKVHVPIESAYDGFSVVEGRLKFVLGTPVFELEEFRIFTGPLDLQRMKRE
jgi:hypothetical protein